MAAPRRYEPPTQQLLVLAREARAAGVTFDDFWEEIVVGRQPNGRRRRWRSTDPNPPPGVIIWPHDSTERKAIYDSIVSTRAAWHRAYDGLPPPPTEAAFQHLATRAGHHEARAGITAGSAVG